MLRVGVEGVPLNFWNQTCLVGACHMSARARGIAANKPPPRKLWPVTRLFGIGALWGALLTIVLLEALVAGKGGESNSTCRGE